MNKFLIENVEYVELPIPAGNTKNDIFFPDLPNLIGKATQGIEAFSALEHAVSATGATVVADADMVNVTVSLYFDGGVYLVMPIASLRRILNRTAPIVGDVPAFNGQNIIWTKSFVTMSATVANYAGKSFVFNVFYKR